MFQHQQRITVQWSDCDPAGIVFFPNYLRWCDDVTSGLFAAAGFPFHVLFPAQQIVGVPIVDVRIQFKTSAAFGTELLVKTSVAEFRNSSFVVQHHFYKQETLVAEGEITRVWTAADPAKPGGLKSRPIPKEIVERLSKNS